MELGLGVLRWPPAEFWAATPHELYAALDGFSESRGGKRESPKSKEAALRDLMDASPYRVKSIKGDPKAVVMGGRKR